LPKRFLPGKFCGRHCVLRGAAHWSGPFLFLSVLMTSRLQGGKTEVQILLGTTVFL
jgi:hypothetical protein